MIIWNLTYQATPTSAVVTKTLAAWGITNFKRKRVSQAPDEISFTTAEKSTTDPQFAYDGKVTVTAVKDGISTIWFVGWIGDPSQSLSGTQERRNYKAKNAWKWFDQIVFQKIWYRVVSPVSAASSLVGGYRSKMILNMGFNNSHQTISQQMTDIVAFVNQVATQQGLGNVIQLGVCPVTTPPWSDVSDITVGEAVKHEMRWMPDAVTTFDYTTTPPTLNITKVFTPLTINLADDVIGTVSLTPRNDRVVDRVRIKYAQQNNTNGKAWIYDIWDVYPAPAQGAVGSDGRPLGIFLAEAVSGGYYYQHDGVIFKSNLTPTNYASPSVTAASSFAALLTAANAAANAAATSSSSSPSYSAAAEASNAATVSVAAANAAVAALATAAAAAATQVPTSSTTTAAFAAAATIASAAVSAAVTASSSALAALNQANLATIAAAASPPVQATIDSTQAAAATAAALAATNALAAVTAANAAASAVNLVTGAASAAAIDVIQPENTFKELLLSVNLVGSTVNLAYATVTTIPWGSADWLRQKLPFLRADGAYLDNFSLRKLLHQNGNYVTAPLGQDLITGTLSDGLTMPNGQRVLAEQYTAIYEVAHSQTIASKTNKKGADIQTIKFTATNATSGTYSGVQSSSSGDPIPSGLAQSLYDGLKILQHDGSVTIKSQEIDPLRIWIGNKLSIAGGSSYWNDIMIQTVEESVDMASVNVSVGVPRYLSAGDLVELLRVNRVRQRNIAADTVKSGQASASSSATPTNTHADNSVGGLGIGMVSNFSSNPPVGGVMPAVRMDVKVDAQAGSFSLNKVGATSNNSAGQPITQASAVVLALKDCEGKQLRVRPATAVNATGDEIEIKIVTSEDNIAFGSGSGLPVWL